MCDVVAKAYALGFSRRALLGRAGVAMGAAAGAGLLSASPAGATGVAPPAPAAPTPAPAALTGYRTKLVLLGTAGGPVWWPDTNRMGISSAVAIGQDVYLVDCGEGVGTRYRQTDLAVDGSSMTLNRLRALFLTHLHSDHTIDYPNLPIFGLFAGLQQPRKPVQVYGPGNRGALPEVVGNRPTPPIINPSDPTPGIEAMTEYLYRAYAADLNDRLRDSGAPDPHSRWEVHDIPLPPGAAQPNEHPPPPVAPFPVYEDERLKVTATLVDHGQVFPSFGFRFDTDDGSIAFSGDTAPSDNLIRLAQGADVLVHEVIDRAWVEAMFGQPPFTPEVQAIVTHLINSHTTIEQVGSVAERAGARTLVLNHFVPGNNPSERWQGAQQGFSGKLVVGEDLMQLGIGRRVKAKAARAR